MVLHWKGLVIVVGPNGSWMDFNYGSEEDPLCVVAEVDCCRIVTPANAEILQKLHPVIVSVRSIGSTDPAALLFDATDAFQEGDVQADANIRAMEEDEQLVVAVQDCLRAALSEFDINKQQEFLRYREGEDVVSLLCHCCFILVCLLSVSERPLSDGPSAPRSTRRSS